MKKLEHILEQYKSGNLEEDDAVKAVQSLFYRDIDHTVIDMDRQRRTGHPEVVYCESKRVSEIRDIFTVMIESGANILGTRMSEQAYTALAPDFPQAKYDPISRLFTIQQHEADDAEDMENQDSAYTSAKADNSAQAESSRKSAGHYIAVVSAGTSDRPVAEEAAQTAEFYGHEVRRFSDAGVAGLHRLLRRLDEIRGARVVITVAGMEGALGSVVGGLVHAPVIAVPTSVGYGANFNGLSALLSMLNSCSSGLSVVNIDNGFGAGYLAAMINAL